MDRQRANADAADSNSEKPSGSESRIAAGAGLVGSAVVLFLLLRVIAVAHWDWAVAGDIADSVNFNSALGAVLGTLFARPEITGALVIILTPLAAVDLIWSWGKGSLGSLGQWLLAIFFGIVLTMLTTTFGWWWLVAGSVLLTVLVLVLRISWRSGRRHKFIATLLRRTGVLSLAAALVLSVALDTPWNLYERISTKDEVIDGYVLKNESGFLRVLEDSPRKVRILISGDVVSRELLDGED